MFSSPRRWLFIVIPLLTFSLVYYIFRLPESNPVPVNTEVPHTEEPIVVVEENAQEPPKKTTEPTEDECGHLLHQLDDVMVVLKTGATESLEKVPIHLRTTFKCVPHFAIFSDYEEMIDGVRTYDVLQNITSETRENQPEFGIYRRLQEVGREGLTDAEWGDNENGPLGKLNNPGWKLDKWKFLPMIDGALDLMPDAKWYVFLEADTYMVWPNLVNWLSHLDHERQYYLGSPMQIGDVLFGYGGAGIVLSRYTMELLSEHRGRSQLELEEMTAAEWAGDCALARALQDVRVGLTWAWPMMMTSRPWEIDHFSEGYGRQPWCYPVISYHHMEPEDINTMWKFDRQFFASGKNALLLHADVYQKLVYNDTVTALDDWDNMSGARIDFAAGTIPSVETCAEVCARNEECLQYSFDEKEGICKHASTTFAGFAKNGTSSGWIRSRVSKLLKAFQSSCEEVEYIFD
ncbi:uncharacterized protein N7506_001480 [Penicillium brevicompactum]|uniref:uncharacterized protein n=1 Tax=Penicillium brevicompactum TaxID=5074 RepID=UPI00253F8EAF|nr:uncharacterized protein N7506_001480 [Penicillium brevicompactum]KAJ5348227.1 hypothetical protein N7506_001480 [Penicillium brevicompactum]